MFFFLTMQSKISLALLPNSCFFRLKKTAAALDGRSLISGLCIAYLASHKYTTVAVLQFYYCLDSQQNKPTASSIKKSVCQVVEVDENLF